MKKSSILSYGLLVTFVLATVHPLAAQPSWWRRARASKPGVTLTNALKKLDAYRKCLVQGADCSRKKKIALRTAASVALIAVLSAVGYKVHRWKQARTMAEIGDALAEDDDDGGPDEAPKKPAGAIEPDIDPKKIENTKRVEQLIKEGPEALNEYLRGFTGVDSDLETAQKNKQLKINTTKEIQDWIHENWSRLDDHTKVLIEGFGWATLTEEQEDELEEIYERRYGTGKRTVTES